MRMFEVIFAIVVIVVLLFGSGLYALDAEESMRKCQETNSYETCVVILR